MKFYIALTIALMATNLAQAQKTHVSDSRSEPKLLSEDSNINAISTTENGLRGSEKFSKSGIESGHSSKLGSSSILSGAMYSHGSKSGDVSGSGDSSGLADEDMSSSKSGKGKSGHFKGKIGKRYKGTDYGHFSSKTPFTPENANGISFEYNAPLGICPCIESCGCVCLYEPEIGNDCLTTDQANTLIATADTLPMCSSDGIGSQDACDALAVHVPDFLSKNGFGSPLGYTCVRAWNAGITKPSGHIDVYGPDGVSEVVSEVVFEVVP